MIALFQIRFLSLLLSILALAPNAYQNAFHSCDAHSNANALISCNHFHNVSLVDANSDAYSELVSPDPEMVDRLAWDPGYQLTWFDFQAEPREDWPHIAAITTSSILYKYHCAEGKLNYEVEAIFRKSESWVRPEARTPPYLKHEQLHFDITELYARKIRAELSRYDFKCGEEDIFESHMRRMLDQWQREEVSYDMDTSFSQDEDRQHVWNVNVRNELLRYGKYMMLP